MKKNIKILIGMLGYDITKKENSKIGFGYDDEQQSNEAIYRA
jgi:hypothetical protein